MPDYVAQAASIYDPQLAAEKGQVDAGYQSNLAGFDTESKLADQAYNDALVSNKKTVAAQDDASNFTASTHGLWSSGLAANMIRLNEQGGADNATKIATARATKLADVAARRQGTTLKYNADLGALTSKYQGSKNEYIASHQNEDAKAAAAEAAAEARQARSDARASASAAAKEPSARDVQGSLNQDIYSALQFYSDPKNFHKGAREDVINTLAQNYGLNKKDIAGQVYGILDDGWDHKMRGVK